MFSIFKKFKESLKKTTMGALSLITSIFEKKIDAKDIELIEESLYGADFGYETSEKIVSEIKKAYSKNKELQGKQAAQIGVDCLCDILKDSQANIEAKGGNLPTVISLVGVNGSGKTTTCAKLANLLSKDGKVIMGACDTFRAAANEQIKLWAERLNIELVESHHGADSAAVAFDAWQAAKARGAKYLILDTAGRLHNKENLMKELEKFRRVIAKCDENAPHYSIMVADGSLGSNSIEQAKAFNKIFPLDGIIVTKLDGTSRGGALAGIYKELALPIFYVGLGEAVEDLQKFNVEAYAKGVFGLE
ncbi:MAG: signal recognition particle-docking protein FtsY [Opitutales bacterium]